VNRNIEFYTMGFTGVEADPMMDDPVTFVGSVTHSNAATVSKLSIDANNDFGCLNSTEFSDLFYKYYMRNTPRIG
jgi:hypothetical protein